MRKQNLKNKRGQVALEYILIVMAVVGFGMASYQYIRERIRKPLGIVKNKMERGDAWSGGKRPDSYYGNMQYIAK